MLSLFLRSQGVQQVEFESNFTWVLENLNDTQKVAVLVEECNQASAEL